MAEKRKPKEKTELVNLRFYENQKRQALTTAVGEEEEDVALAREVKQWEPCNTVGEKGNLLTSEVGSSSEESQNTCDNDNTSQLVSCVTSSPISAPSDKSRKGSVDQRISNLVNLINREKDNFFTTSSCSGRIILYTWERNDAEPAEMGRLKKGCKWLLVSHDEINPEMLVTAYFENVSKKEEISGDVFFKMEPCILHIQCRTMSSARKLVHIATESGFRNSGMVVGKENRITVAVRSAMGLEVPFPVLGSLSSQMCISEQYLKYLAEVANSKMRENWNRSEKLTGLFASTTWT